MEEYDLAYRVLDAGYTITYSDKIIMLHKESPLGRKPKKEKLLMMWVNKSNVAWRYLPKKYFYSTAFMWSLQYLKETGFDLAGFFTGWKKISRIPGSVQRTTIQPGTLAFLKEVKARLWY
jgi:GT2 family glycosyltransferase